MRDLSRQLVVRAAMGKRRLVPRLEEDLDLLLKEGAVGRISFERRAQRGQFAADVASANAKAETALSEDIGDGKVLGQPQRVPRRHGVEHAAQVEPLRVLSQIDGQHRDIGDAAIALALEVVFSQPQGVVASRVHQLRHGAGFGKDRGEVLVRLNPLIHRPAGKSQVVHGDVPTVKVIEFHGLSSRLLTRFRRAISLYSPTCQRPL